MTLDLLSLNEIRSITHSERQKLYDFYNSNLSDSRWSQKFFQNYFSILHRSPLVMALKDSETIAGLIMGRKEINSPRHYRISALIIDPAYRGRGYGKILVDAFIRSISDRSVNAISVSFRDGKKLEKFYSGCGFKNDRVVGEYSNGEKKHRMEMTLKP